MHLIALGKYLFWITCPLVQTLPVFRNPAHLWGINKIVRLPKYRFYGDFGKPGKFWAPFWPF